MSAVHRGSGCGTRRGQQDMSLIARELARGLGRPACQQRAPRGSADGSPYQEAARDLGSSGFPWNIPVSVLAGPNGCGKSTVSVCVRLRLPMSPGRGIRANFTPASLFPNFTSRQQTVSSDAPQQTRDRVSSTCTMAMRALHDLEAGAGHWTRSFMQPQRRVASRQRQVYLRTLANLTNPFEVRSVLQLGPEAGSDRDARAPSC